MPHSTGSSATPAPACQHGSLAQLNWTPCRAESSCSHTSSPARCTALSLLQATPQPNASFLLLGACKYLLGWEPVPVQIPQKVSPLRLIKRKQECLLKRILRVFTSLNRAFYQGFPYTTPQRRIAVSQLSFISNHVIVYYEANNNQVIAGIAQQLWQAQESSISAKLWGKCRA